MKQCHVSYKVSGDLPLSLPPNQSTSYDTTIDGVLRRSYLSV